MKPQELREQLNERVRNKAAQIIKKKAEEFQTYLKYEITIANMEFAFRSGNHGSDYKYLSDKYSDNIVISQPDVGQSKVQVSVTIPQYVFATATEYELEMLKQYVIPNAIKRLNQ